MSYYSGKQAKFYDIIHSEKKYDIEIQFLINLYENFLSKTPKSVLDVGCGTGSHTIRFAERNYNILGIDISNDMIQFAKKKHTNKNLEFINCGISNVNRKFDLSYSLFNVINHILKFEDLISFFKGIKSTLNKDGLYVFDCYNGIATILDNPRDRVKERHIGSDKIVIKTKCDYNDFEETLVLNNVVKYKKKIIEYSIKHRIWKPESLKDIMNYVGLELIKIYKSFDLNAVVKKEDYKIVFACKLK